MVNFPHRFCTQVLAEVLVVIRKYFGEEGNILVNFFLG